MSILGNGGGDVHHHGLLAGASAAALAVIVIPLLALLLARQAMSAALADMIWLLFAAAVLGVVLLASYAGVHIVHRHRMLSAAVPAAVRAEVVHEDQPAITAQAVPAIAPAAVHLHLPEGMDPEQVAVLLAGLRAGSVNPELPGAE